MANKLDAIKSLMKDNPAITVFWDIETDTVKSIKYHNSQTPLTDKQIEDEKTKLTNEGK